MRVSRKDDKDTGFRKEHLVLRCSGPTIDLTVGYVSMLISLSACTGCCDTKTSAEGRVTTGFICMAEESERRDCS